MRYCLNIPCVLWIVMGFRSQSGSRRNAARQFSRSAHEKKAKEKKQRYSGKYVEEETQVSPKDAVEKTLGSLSRLGNQIFALSPFSQYFDDWVVTLRQVISEFESNPALKVDEQFVKERSQIFLDVEGALAEKRVQESSMTGEAKELADNNHLLVETDKEYAEKTRQLSHKRNADVQRLSTEIRDLEDDVASQEEIKISFYKFNARKKAAEQLVQTRQALKSKKNELEVTLSSFTADQEKLHDSYEEKKQEITEKIESLHKALEALETDTSATPRQTACNALANAINAFLQRRPPSAEPQQP
jgi:chromosome segregation ATPase